jgi:hypothetical protein
MISYLVTNVTYVVRKHYENFETIDWLKDLMRNRIRHRNIRAQRRQSWKKRLIFWFDSWSGWICVLLVGVSAGKFILGMEEIRVTYSYFFVVLSSRHLIFIQEHSLKRIPFLLHGSHRIRGVPEHSCLDKKFPERGTELKNYSQELNFFPPWRAPLLAYFWLRHCIV